MEELLLKYNTPIPRYTSYPPVPYWEEENFSEKSWIHSLQQGFAAFGKREGVSLYIHLPYCESMCTFCGCNKRITKNHKVEAPYIEGVLREWELYLERFPKKPMVVDLHLGGGTPTFFSPKNLEWLVSGILDKAEVSAQTKFSFEGHPNNTNGEHLQTLYDLGFRRVSFGIQDFDPVVQRAINRIQTYERVKTITDMAREIGYSSVNYDVIYGLPFQQLSSVENTMHKVIDLLPDRIAYYSYAHVPWIRGLGQRKFFESDLPSPLLKQELHLKGRELLVSAGYNDIAMDHFALQNDDLSKAFIKGELNRNFMGYTELNNKLTIGLGVSAIGDSAYGMAQNVKDISKYLDLLGQGFIPVLKGHLFNREDWRIRQAIHNLMCNLKTGLAEDFPFYDEIIDRLDEPLTDGLVELHEGELSVTTPGKFFLRNICAAFDLRLWRKQPETRIFSMAV